MSNDLLFFESFAKGKKVQKFKGSNCVIYTRVSTKEQADNNMSLETQRKHCEQFAIKNQYQIRGYFGGTYESAKTDEQAIEVAETIKLFTEIVYRYASGQLNEEQSGKILELPNQKNKAA